MSANLQTSDEDILTISLPTQVTPLLLPNVTIAEIVNFESIRNIENLPEWCVGVLDWRGEKIPLIAFEVFTNNSFEYTLNNQHRIAIINSISGSTLPAYAFLTKGIPKLLRLRPSDIEDLEGVEHESEQIRVLINDEETIIPDLRYLEKIIQSEFTLSSES